MLLRTNLLRLTMLIIVMTSCTSNNYEDKLLLARQYGDRGNYSKAIEILDEIIKNDPQNVRAYSNKSAYVSLFPERHEEAIDLISKAIELDSLCADCYRWRGSITNGKKAVGDLNRAVRLNSNDIRNFQMRAFMRGELGDHFGAIEDYNHASTMNPDGEMNLRIYSGRGRSFLDLRRFSDALVDLDRAIELDSMDANTYFLRFICNLNLGSKKSAMKDLDKCILLGIDSVYASRGRNLLLGTDK